MVGRYAISFAWSDGHDTGIYPYDYLLQMCECEACAGEPGAEAQAGRINTKQMMLMGGHENGRD